MKGLAAADITPLIGFAGFIAAFFFLTLYMQNVLGYSPIKSGLAFLPVAIGVGLVARISPRLIGRLGTRPLLLAGSLTAAGGIYWLSRIPVNGSCSTDLLPGMMIMSFGLGAQSVAALTASRRRARACHFLRHRNLPHQPSARNQHRNARSAHLGLPESAACR